MIIKPIDTKPEFLAYGRARYSNNSVIQLTGLFKQNISREKDKYEFDAYDLDSFHFGAFDDQNLHACTRMVNDTVGTQKFKLNSESSELLRQLTDSQKPENGLALEDYVKSSEQEEVKLFFRSLRNEGFCFNEIGRLIRDSRKGEKHLMNYMICYSWAFNRFYEIDFCFFQAGLEHCSYYQQYFNCKHVLRDIEFTPIVDGEPCFLMQATANDLPQEMDEIVNRIVEKFVKAGTACAVAIDEIK